MPNRLLTLACRAGRAVIAACRLAHAAMVASLKDKAVWLKYGQVQ